ncbi:MAG TPA: hypothetical protein VEQ60_23150 [Longimicrobium sp.]|nr:hypothetical protein [Longimicrobium sp.]
MKSLRLSALAAALVLGACSAPSPTDPARLAPSFDEGPGMMGSGHLTSETQDGGNTIGSGNGVGGTTTTSSDSTGTQRGGGSLGSGN